MIFTAKESTASGESVKTKVFVPVTENDSLSRDEDQLAFHHKFFKKTRKAKVK